MATYYVQPKFDPKITNLANPILGAKYGNLKRGFMIWDQVITGYKQKAVIHYLYNPSSVEADYSAMGASSNASQYAALYPIGTNQGNLVVPMSQTASWSILFDRTFELIGQGANNSAKINDVQTSGVGVDVLSMMQFTGMLQSTGSATVSSGTSNGIWPTVMQLIPSYAFFGGTGNNAVRFYGYVNEWSVTYTHWTHNMVPMRCVIDVSWTMLPPPSNTSTTSAGSNVNWVNPTPGQVKTRVLSGSGSGGIGGR